MKFDELEARMRAFEDAHAASMLPQTYVVARLDGRGFTALTKESLDLARPFDVRFRDWMLATVGRLMECGFRVRLGYMQSDEISLLFDRDDATFGRTVRKWTSVLAGEASAAFSIAAGRACAFDCRLIEFPREDLVVDYFRWRGEDAARNALNAWCYWTLRGEGVGASEASQRLEQLSTSGKNELLFQRGINFNEVPAWQRRGCVVMWERFDKPSINPVTGATTSAERRRLTTVLELPMREALSAFFREAIRTREVDGSQANLQP